MKFRMPWLLLFGRMAGAGGAMLFKSKAQLSLG